MDDTRTYKVSAKRANGKFWGFGNLKKNQYGNWSIGMKVTPELKELINSNDGKWVNFSLFEDDKKEPTKSPTAGAVLSDDIPFSPRYWF